MTRPMTIRPYELRDHDSVTALYNAARPLGMGIPDLENGTACRLVAVSDSGQLIGYGAASGQDPSNLVLVVSPNRQRQGIGSQLWERLRRELATLGTTALQPWVRQENTAGVAWLEKHDFRQIDLDGPVQLLLADLEMDAFPGGLGRDCRAGVYSDNSGRGEGA